MGPPGKKSGCPGNRGPKPKSPKCPGNKTSIHYGELKSKLEENYSLPPKNPRGSMPLVNCFIRRSFDRLFWNQTYTTQAFLLDLQ
jgi:hypothetical protein